MVATTFHSFTFLALSLLTSFAAADKQLNKRQLFGNTCPLLQTYNPDTGECVNLLTDA